MTEEIPGVPIALVPATVAPNSDLPSDPFASLQRISVVDSVGPAPGGANRQETALEQRDETLRTVVNLLATAVNALDAIFLRRDGTAQQDSVAGLEGNIPANGYILTGLGDGSASGDSTAYGQLYAEIDARTTAVAAVVADLAAYAPLSSPALTGAPTAPTPSPLTDSSTKLATTAFVSGALAASTYEAIELNYTGSVYTYTATRDVVVFLTAVGGGSGGNSDGGPNNGHAGGGGGAIIDVPFALASGDTIQVLVGASASGGRPGVGAAGNQTVVTVTKASWAMGPLYITCQGGGAPTGSVPGAGGTVNYQLLNDSTSGYTYPVYPAAVTGGTGGVGSSTAHNYSQGGASALAPGGLGTGLTQPLVSGVMGSGGGGGDAGSDGGAGYAVLTIVNRP